jgi:hypothetical protein
MTNVTLTPEQTVHALIAERAELIRIVDELRDAIRALKGETK